MVQRARRLAERARGRNRLAAEQDPHARPVGPVPVPGDGPRTVDGDVPAGAPRARRDSDGTLSADTDEPGAPAPAAPDLDVPGGISGPPRPGGPPPASGRDRGRGSLLAPDAPHEAERDVPAGLRVAAAWSWRVVVVGAALFLGLRAAGSLAVVVVPVIVALLLAALLQPGAAWLRHRGWRTSLSAVVVLVIGVGFVAGLLTLVVTQFAAGYSDLADRVGQGVDQIRDVAVRTLPVSQSQIDDALDSARTSISDNRGVLTSGALTTAVTLGEVLTGALLTLFTLFFFLKDGRQIWLWAVGLAPTNSQAYLDEAARRSWRTLISYVRATVAVAAFDAILIGVGLLLLGTPLVIPLAALVFLGAFIPIIGSFLAGTVSVLVTLVAVGPVQALIALGIILLVMQLEGHVLQPLLLGRAVSVHPLAVVLGIATGLLSAGIFGALIAVPVIACANVAGTYLSRRHEGPPPPQPATRRAKRLVAAD